MGDAVNSWEEKDNLVTQLIWKVFVQQPLSLQLVFQPMLEQALVCVTGFQVTQGKYEKSLLSKEVLIRYKFMSSSKLYMLCNGFDLLNCPKWEINAFSFPFSSLIIRAITPLRVVKSFLRQA